MSKKKPTPKRYLSLLAAFLVAITALPTYAFADSATGIAELIQNEQTTNVDPEGIDDLTNEADAPKATEPEADAPEADAPEADAPETAEPETTEPETTEPETADPEVVVPETTEPEAATNEAANFAEVIPQTYKATFFDGDTELTGKEFNVSWTTDEGDYTRTFPTLDDTEAKAFVGWMITINGQSYPADAGVESKLGAFDATCTAIWKDKAPVKQYTITYDLSTRGQWPAGQTPTEESLKVNEGGSYTIPTSIPTRAYSSWFNDSKNSNMYRFNGWEITSGAAEINNGTISNVASDITIKAKWQVEISYTYNHFINLDNTIPFDLPKGKLTNTVWADVNSLHTVPDFAPPSDQAWEFVDWFKWNDNKGPHFANGTKLSVGDVPIALNSSFRLIDKGSIYFYQNFTPTSPSDVATGITEKILKPVGEVIPYPADPTRYGYTFEGWSENPVKKDGEKLLKAGDKFTFIKNQVKRYAQWSANESVWPTITYRTGVTKVPGISDLRDDATFGESSEYKFDVAYKKAPNAKTQLANIPTRDGYTFDGWSDAAQTYPVDTKEITIVKESVVLTATWKDNEAKWPYVNFEMGQTPDRKVVTDAVMSTNTHGFNYTDKTQMRPNAQFKVPESTLKGYTFIGWKQKFIEDGSIFTTDGKKFGMPIYDRTLIAVWGTPEVQTGTLIFNANANDDTTVSNMPENIAATAVGTEILLDTKPTRTGFVFKGWSLQSGTATDLIPFNGKFTIVKGASNLYAQWEFTGFTVKFVNYNDALLSSTAVKSGITPTPPDDPSRVDPDKKFTYEFAGWTPEILPVTADVTYKATYNKFATISFYASAESDVVLSTQKVQLVNDSEKVTLAPTGYTLPAHRTLTGWSAGTTVVPVSDLSYTVTQNVRMNAVTTPIPYNVSYLDSDQNGKVIPALNSTFSIDNDKIITPTSNSTYIPRKTDFELLGFTANIDLPGYKAGTTIKTATVLNNVPLGADVIFTPVFSRVSYTVRFVDFNDVLLSSQSVKVGAFPVIPTLPTRASDSSYTYTFAGWNTPVVSVNSDATYRATYNANSRGGGGGYIPPYTPPTPTTPTPTPTDTIPDGNVPTADGTTPTTDGTDDVQTITLPETAIPLGPVPNPGLPAPVEEVITDGAIPQGAPEEEIITDGSIPQGAPDEEVITDGSIPQAAPAAGWALLNLVLTVLTAIGSTVLLVNYFARKKDEDGDRSDDTKHRRILRLLSIIPAVAAVVAFVLTENMNTPMAIFDKWTIMMVVIAAIQVVVMFASKKKIDKDSQDNSTAQANA